MLAELLLATAIGLVTYAFYKWATLNNDYFAKRNLPFQKPVFLIGNWLTLFFGLTAAELSQKFYNNFTLEKMYGVLEFRSYLVVVRDPELLKQLTVKEFDHFEDHRNFVTDELFGSSLFLMKGQRWRDMRATLSPAFTGSKMRQMFDFVSECADNMAKHFVQISAKGEKIEMEMKDLFSRYTNDVIATSAFGIRVNSFENPKNEFFLAGKQFLNFGSVGTLLRFFFLRAFPRLAKALDIQFIAAPIRHFFTKMIVETMDERRKRGIVRNDMVNILMQLRQGKLTEEVASEKTQNDANDSAGFATVDESDIGKKGSTREWTENEIIAQAFIFFAAGFDTSSTAMTFSAYELSTNPEIQQKLYEEIAVTESNLGGKRVTYDTLQKMKYLDQVVSEILRKWPPATTTDRLCVKSFECNYDEGKYFRFDKGVGLQVPIYGFHHDPQYFPDPEKFDPERFNDDNKNSIIPGTYLPFGIGPRNCIGSRFALMELKAILYYILLNFKMVPNANTQIPIRLKKSPFSLQTEKGLFLEFVPRK